MAGVCLMMLLWSCSTRNNALVRTIFYPPVPKNSQALGVNTQGAVFDHSRLDKVLQANVTEEGFVDYVGLGEASSAAELDAYVKQLGELEPTGFDALSRYEQLALLINAYNAFTLRLMLDYPEVASIKEIPGGERWKAERWLLASGLMSLDAIEHERIRMAYADPRIHFALVCASVGCPPLRADAFTGATLEAQLEDQARRFFAHPRNFKWEDGTVYVSELLDWFRGDFGGAELLETIRPWVPVGARDFPAGAPVKWMKYDWSLNQAR